MLGVKSNPFEPEFREQEPTEEDGSRDDVGDWLGRCAEKERTDEHER